MNLSLYKLLLNLNNFQNISSIYIYIYIYKNIYYISYPQPFKVRTLRKLLLNRLFMRKSYFNGKNLPGLLISKANNKSLLFNTQQNSSTSVFFLVNIYTVPILKPKYISFLYPCTCAFIDKQSTCLFCFNGSLGEDAWELKVSCCCWESIMH